MSLVAECVEFNEETMLSHKTWKTKEYCRDKELEELTDIYFFFAQLVNYLDDNKNKALKEAADEVLLMDMPGTRYLYLPSSNTIF